MQEWPRACRSTVSRTSHTERATPPLRRRRSPAVTTGNGGAALPARIGQGLALLYPTVQVRHEPIPYGLVIFDADNTLRRTLVPGQPCPRAPNEWELLPGVAQRMRAIAWGSGGVWLGVASNQDQVAYGYLSEATARDLLTEMISAASGHIPPPDAIQLCPHAVDADCACRKPAPGMLLNIIHSYRMSTEDTLFVGDAATDREAARRAGVSFCAASEFFSSMRSSDD